MARQKKTSNTDRKFQDPKLEQITSLLKKEFNPTRLFLFGSRTSGNVHSESGVYAKDWGSRTFVSRNRPSLGF